MPSVNRSRGWCFTLNNYTQEEEKEVHTWDAQYVIYGREEGDAEHTPHLQGYVYFKNKKTLKAIKKLNGRAHWERQMGTCEQAINYCKKEDTSPYEKGTPPRTGGGARDNWNDINDMVNNGASWDEIRNAYPGSAMRYHGGIEKAIACEWNNKQLAVMAKKYENVKLKLWQEKVVTNLEHQQDRKVLWIVDPIGNQGKTWLAKYLVVKKQAFYTTAGKKADVQHAWKGQRYVVIDCSRQKQEFFNYEIIEEFKNGMVCKAKYDSRTVICKFCRIVVFSNWDPDTSKLSQDRWDIMRI